ncbi:MAG: glycerol-3-phosphate 1-O-acyltransferase PlsY [Paracoccaceae bacterium]
MTWFSVALLAYLLGSIPFGMVMARVFGLGDLRKIGSGNIGTTNVLRTGNKSAAALTLIFDAAKGAAAVLIARQLGGEMLVALAALLVMLGHLYPVFLRFKGGKGVATFLGVLLALNWPVGVAACATWLIVALVARYSSLAAISAAALAPVWAVFLFEGTGVILVLLMSAMVVWRHRENIRRLLDGSEPKIGR